MRKPLHVKPTRKPDDDCGCGSSKGVTKPQTIKKK